MKANEAPEKIYLQQYDENTLICLNKWNISEEWSNKPCNENVATNIEYIRKDAFIEKAKKWFEKQNEWHDINGIKHCDMEDFEDFKKYMEGE